MKKFSKIASALAVSAALALGMAGAAFADVVYENQKVSVNGGGLYTVTDLFDNFKNVMPGDKLEQPVTVVNAGDKAIKVYLRAEAHDEVDNPLTYAEAGEEQDGKDQKTDPENGLGGAGQRDENVATMSDFLSKLHMNLMVADDKAVFDDSPDVEGALSENVLLGEVAAGSELQIDATLSVPIELDNTYANRVGEVDWVLTVEEIEVPVVPSDGDDTPAGNLSKTGDTTPFALIAAVAGVAAVVVIVALVFAKRRNKQQ